MLAAGVALCLSVVLLALSVLSFFQCPPWVWTVGISLVTAALLAALFYGFHRYIGEFARRMVKNQLTVRRIQGKSNYLESILDDSTDIIFTTDMDAFILKFNKGSEMHFGYTQEEIVGVPLKQLFVNEADERKILNAVLLSGKSVNEEIPMKTKQGEIILLNLSISEMKNDLEQIIGLVVTAKDITEKKKLEMELVKKNELLSKLAITDSLTELFNVRHFYDQIVRELSRLKRNPQRKLSLMLIDIDHFKELNDTEGHQVGDQVLRSLGQVIKVCIRKDVDAGFRYGGDEFAVILPDTDRNQARVAAERIAKQFGAFKFGRVSLSVGIAEAKAGEDEKSIVKRTDEALYRSKREGRARITLEDETPHT
jgi:diguanylate cyclase (GGDEF)-like protein/PAS domain S-box-containing protein